MERGDWFITASGRQFFTLDPTPDAICIEDIAHALSHVCRYGGHSLRFYSVAQHSVMVSELVSPALALHGLLHDAAEAYCGDVIRPIKRLISGYDAIEHGIATAICDRFRIERFDRLPVGARAEIKHADNVALVTERRDLVAPHAWPWKVDERGFEPHPQRIEPLDPEVARALFLERFEALGGHA